MEKISNKNIAVLADIVDKFLASNAYSADEFLTILSTNDRPLDVLNTTFERFDVFISERDDYRIINSLSSRYVETFANLLYGAVSVRYFSALRRYNNIINAAIDADIIESLPINGLNRTDIVDIIPIYSETLRYSTYNRIAFDNDDILNALLNVLAVYTANPRNVSEYYSKRVSRFYAKFSTLLRDDNDINALSALLDGITLNRYSRIYSVINRYILKF